jgi:hypothetical protein
MVVVSTFPEKPRRWKNPSYASVVAGVSSAGNMEASSMPRRMEFTILFLDLPGWTLRPWTVTFALAALKVS